MTAMLRMFRLCRPTPNGVLLALPIAEGLLFAADRYDWLAFNRLKGHSVLVAAAVAVGTLLLLLGWFSLSVLLRRKFQFGLRSLMLLTVAAAILCGWLTAELDAARRQREAVARLTELGFTCTRVDPRNDESYNTARMITGLSKLPPEIPLLGADFFLEVVELKGGWPVEEKRWIDEFAELPAVERLDLRLQDLSETGLQKIAAMRRLRELRIVSHRLTGEGLESIAQLPQLESLSLHNSQTTGEFLAKFANLEGLLRLELPGAPISDKSLQPLTRAKRLRELDLSYTALTDDGLAALADLPELSLLNVAHTKVTADGLRRLEPGAKRRYFRVQAARTHIHKDDVPSLQKLGFDIWIQSR